MQKLSIIFYKVAKILAIVCAALLGVIALVYLIINSMITTVGNASAPAWVLILYLFLMFTLVACGIATQIVAFIFAGKGQEAVASNANHKSQIVPIVIGALFGSYFMLAAAIIGLIYLNKQAEQAGVVEAEVVETESSQEVNE